MNVTVLKSQNFFSLDLTLRELRHEIKTFTHWSFKLNTLGNIWLCMTNLWW